MRRAMGGEGSDWGLDSHLLAGIFDQLAAANWQRAGDENAERPKPLPRPGSKESQPTKGGNIAEGKPVTTEEMDRLMGWSK